MESALVGNLDADTYEEVPFQGDANISIKVNVGMLQEVCSSLDSDTFELLLSSPQDPLLVNSGAYTVLMASMAVE